MRHIVGAGLALGPTLVALTLVGYLASQRPGVAGELRWKPSMPAAIDSTLAETGGHRIVLGSLESPLAVQALSDRFPS